MIVTKNGRVLYDSCRRVQEPVNMVELAFRSGYKVGEMSKTLGISSRHL